MKQNNEQLPNQSPRWGIVVLVLLLLAFISLISSLVIGLFLSTSDITEAGNVAHISVSGAIVSEAQNGWMSSEYAQSTDIVELIEKANENPEVVAILLEINSPGGTAVASYEIADAVKKSNKTTVAWVREAGASGAYWVASASDHIVANPLSVTGSIGVIGSYVEFSGTLTRYNASYQRLVSGEHKDMGSPLRKLTTDEEEIMQENLDVIRDYFVSEVAKNRKLSKENVSKMADGRFYLGKQAFDLGLVDELGGKEEALAWIEKKEGITAEVAEYETPLTFAEMLFGVLSNQGFSVGEGMGKAIVESRMNEGVSVRT